MACIRVNKQVVLVKRVILKIACVLPPLRSILLLSSVVPILLLIVLDMVTIVPMDVFKKMLINGNVVGTVIL